MNDELEENEIFLAFLEKIWNQKDLDPEIDRWISQHFWELV